MSEFYSNWNYRRYDTNTPLLASPGTQALAEQGMVVQFVHIPTGNMVNFKAFVTAFNETYKSNWSSQQVFGRMDPIYLFKQTERIISMSLKVPAVSASEAYENLGKAQLLAQFLYPVYKDPAQAQTIVQSPLIRLKFMNFMRNSNFGSKDDSDTEGELSFGELYERYDSEGEGLLGTISNVTINHVLDEDGVVEHAGKDGLQAILPKLFEIDFDFSPIHEHPLSWDEHDKFGTFGSDDGSLFPYGVRLRDDSQEAYEKREAERAQAAAPSEPESPSEELPTDALHHAQTRVGGAADADLQARITPAADEDRMENGASETAASAQRVATNCSMGQITTCVSFGPEVESIHHDPGRKSWTEVPVDRILPEGALFKESREKWLNDPKRQESTFVWTGGEEADTWIYTPGVGAVKSGKK